MPKNGRNSTLIIILIALVSGIAGAIAAALIFQSRNQPNTIIVLQTTIPTTQSPALTQPQSEIRQTVQIDARLPWQDTAMMVKKGNILHIHVIDGVWTRWNKEAYQNGSGSGYICSRERSSCVEPLPFAPAGALIGRINDQLFAIGSDTELMAAQTGSLSLAINDASDSLSDNDGVLTVEVTIKGDR